MFQCVYKISCVDENIKEFYIGSTDNFKKRVKSHKDGYNDISKCNLKLYNFIRENGGLSNWEINPIEIFSFLTEEELRQHEQFYMDEYKPELNSYRVILKEEQKIEQRNEYNKEYRKKNIEYYKEYYEKNKETISIKQKEYRVKNKEKIKEKTNCPHCNKEISRNNISRHIKTQHPISI